MSLKAFNSMKCLQSHSISWKVYKVIHIHEMSIRSFTFMKSWQSHSLSWNVDKVIHFHEMSTKSFNPLKVYKDIEFHKMSTKSLNSMKCRQSHLIPWNVHSHSISWNLKQSFKSYHSFTTLILTKSSHQKCIHIKYLMNHTLHTSHITISNE